MAHPGYMTHNERDMIHKCQRQLDSGTITDPVEYLRLLCLARGYSGILGFGRIFREMDHNGKRNLHMQEFMKALHNTGLDLPTVEAEAVFHHFDDDGTGHISVDALMDGIKVSRK
jgi:calcyphosin